MHDKTSNHDLLLALKTQKSLRINNRQQMRINMYEISMSEASSEFTECWKAAGIHIQNQAQGGLRGWLKVDLNPPFLEHLSFRLGNQLFFIRIIDVDGQLETPGNS